MKALWEVVLLILGVRHRPAVLIRVGEGMIKMGEKRREEKTYPWAKLPFTRVAHSCCMINANKSVNNGRPQMYLLSR